MNRRSFVGFGTLAAGALISKWFARTFADETKPAPGATVSTTAGKVRGTEQGKIHSFKGVPYADTTAGSNRFMPPAKLKSWIGVRDCFEFGPRSPQFLESFHGQVPPSSRSWIVMSPWEKTASY